MINFGDCNCNEFWVGMAEGVYEQARPGFWILRSVVGATPPSRFSPGSVIKTVFLPQINSGIVHAESQCLKQGLWSITLTHGGSFHGQPGDTFPGGLLAWVHVYDDLGGGPYGLVPFSLNEHWVIGGGGAPPVLKIVQPDNTNISDEINTGVRVRLKNPNQRFVFRLFIDMQFGVPSGGLVLSDLIGTWSC